LLQIYAAFQAENGASSQSTTQTKPQENESENERGSNV
jgi:hypothetical protein